MNIRQFLSSLTFLLVEGATSRWGIARALVTIPIRLIFPKMGYERLQGRAMDLRTAAAIYASILAIAGAAQGALAWQAGHFWPQANQRIDFLEDGWNLANYFAIVPLYVITGVGYLMSLFSLEGRFAGRRAADAPEISNEGRPYVSGALAFFLFASLLLWTQASYAIGVRTQSAHLFWFHGAAPGAAFEFNGYFYLLVNALLASFVILVAILLLEMFRWSSILSASIRELRTAPGQEIHLDFWTDIDRVKRYFAPFTETAIWAKACAVFLAINLYTWKESGVNAGDGGTTTFFDIIFLIYVIIVIFLVSLPRHRVQYEIFQLMQSVGVHEYRDVRMPWLIGWSALIDFLLVAFLSHAIFRGRLDEFIINLIS